MKCLMRDMIHASIRLATSIIPGPRIESFSEDEKRW
jgi:hypothetical protein